MISHVLVIVLEFFDNEVHWNYRQVEVLYSTLRDSSL